MKAFDGFTTPLKVRGLRATITRLGKESSPSLRPVQGIDAPLFNLLALRILRYPTRRRRFENVSNARREDLELTDQRYDHNGSNSASPAYYA